MSPRLSAAPRALDADHGGPNAAVASAISLKITLMLGGPSAEREVSLWSGAAVAQALRSLGHQVIELDPKTPEWSLPAGTQAVFLALHGTYGEDGTVQARLEELGLPFTGWGPEASMIACAKVLAKQRCLEARDPTARVKEFLRS